jgi:hypothetical protein
MSRPVLSICIPSYQRARLLSGLLGELDVPDLLPFGFEVIVADNASPGGEYDQIARHAPRHHAYRYYRNSDNLGPLPNLFGALRRAQGEFCLYLADDDRLEIASLIEAVQIMRENPDIAATQGCWQMLDLVTNSITPAQIPFDALLFTRDDAANLYQQYFFTRFLPEIGLYRTDTLGLCLWPGEIFYWPFMLTERLLRLGTIRVTDKPFYNSVVRHPGEPYPRETLADGLDIAIWQKITLSYDFLMTRHCSPADRPHLDAFTAELAEMRNWFLERGLNASVARQDHVTTLEVASLLAVRGVARDFMTDRWWAELRQRAGLSAFVQALGWTPEVKAVALHGFDDHTKAALSKVLRRYLPADTAILEDGAEPSEVLAFLVDSDLRRAEMLARDVAPGLVSSLETLRRFSC